MQTIIERKRGGSKTFSYVVDMENNTMILDFNSMNPAKQMGFYIIHKYGFSEYLKYEASLITCQVCGKRVFVSFGVDCLRHHKAKYNEIIKYFEQLFETFVS
jgi:hypothetical protein